MDKVDWRSLAATLTDMAEDEVKRLLDLEVTHYKRPAIVRRLHQRYSILRTQRERKSILEGLEK